MVLNPLALQTSLFDLSEAEKPQKKDSTVRFYEDVRKEYHRLFSIKKNGVRLYNTEYILAEVGKKFYRSPRTIENIIFGRV